MLKQEGKSGEKCSSSESMGDLDLYPHGPGSLPGSIQSLAPIVHPSCCLPEVPLHWTVRELYRIVCGDTGMFVIRRYYTHSIRTVVIICTYTLINECEKWKWHLAKLV